VGINIEFGAKLVVKLTVSQQRALRTTLEIAEAVAKHIEDYGVNEAGQSCSLSGSASRLLENGLRTFVATYAVATYTPEEPKT